MSGICCCREPSAEEWGRPSQGLRGGRDTVQLFVHLCECNGGAPQEHLCSLNGERSKMLTYSTNELEPRQGAKEVSLFVPWLHSDFLQTVTADLQGCSPARCKAAGSFPNTDCARTWCPTGNHHACHYNTGHGLLTICRSVCMTLSMVWVCCSCCLQYQTRSSST